MAGNMIYKVGGNESKSWPPQALAWRKIVGEGVGWLCYQVAVHITQEILSMFTILSFAVEYYDQLCW